MVFDSDLSQNSSFRSFSYEGYSKRDAMKAYGPDKNYHRATLYNIFTGEREEIELFDPNDEDNEDLLALNIHLELKTDLRNAFATFTPTEKLILFRVLLQGKSVHDATKRMRMKSTRTWERWLQSEALPRLRTLLEDYYKNGRVVVQ